MTQSPAIALNASYSAEHFDPLFAAEDRHFWFRARNRCIGAATHLLPNRESIREVVEHGCGTGFVLAELKRLFPDARVTGTDLFAEGLALARRRFDGLLVQMDVLQCDYRQEIDLIGMFDVLEHLDDDLRVLKALHGQLRPGGSLLLTVPAHMALWSDFDVASGHRRRYTRQQLTARLIEAGFKVEYCTEFMCALLPAMWVRRRLCWGRRGSAGNSSNRMKAELQVHPLLNRVLELAFQPESLWIKRKWGLPIGTSLLAVAVRAP